VGRFTNEHILVVGATSDIGMAISRALVREGARLTISGRSQEKLQAIAADLGPDTSTLACDLLDQDARADLLKNAAQASGKLNGLVYVAGYHRLMPLAAGYQRSLGDHLALNVEVPLDLVRAFTSRHVSDEAAQRSVTLIASIAHRIGEPALSAYSASKAAMVGATRALATELARKNIRINTVSPGWVFGASAEAVSSKLPAESMDKISQSYPLGFGAPEDVAEAVLYVASRAAKWVTGSDLVVDGGRTCV
jgi:NAD(P)-dependent dehydrogenase (short-subunit alcohol dehydrogenase family)